MEGERPLVVTEEYERLGGKKLSLIDVLAQSVGFIGPVFSAAFIIPLIIGVNAAARGAGTSAALAVLIAGVGIFALGWIVAQYAKRIHAAGSLYDYVSNGLGKTVGAAAGWLYYGGTIILTTGLGVLIGGYVHDNLLPAWEIDLDLPIWVWDTIFALLLFAVLYFGVKISTRVQLTLALISIAVVLIFFITVIVDLRERQRRREGVRPDAAARRVHRDPVRGPVRGPDLRRVRDGGQPRRGDGRAEALDPEGRPRRGRDRLDLLPDRRVRGGRRVRVRPRGHHEPGGRRRPAVRARRARESLRVRSSGSRSCCSSCSSTCWPSTSARPSRRRVACSRWLATGGSRGCWRRSRSGTGRPSGAIFLLMVDPGAPDRRERGVGRPVRAAGSPALLLAVRLVRDVRCVRADRRVLPACRSVACSGSGMTQGRVGVVVACLARDRDHGRGDLRLVLQGAEPDDSSRRGTR